MTHAFNIDLRSLMTFLIDHEHTYNHACATRIHRRHSGNPGLMFWTGMYSVESAITKRSILISYLPSCNQHPIVLDPKCNKMNNRNPKFRVFESKIWVQGPGLSECPQKQVLYSQSQRKSHQQAMTLSYLCYSYCSPVQHRPRCRDLHPVHRMPLRYKNWLNSHNKILTTHLLHRHCQVICMTTLISKAERTEVYRECTLAVHFQQSEGYI